MSDPIPNDFDKASAAPARGIIAEFWLFMKCTKKFWLLPLLVILLGLGLMILLGGTAAAPFIYTLF
jgi:hypothetical protein